MTLPDEWIGALLLAGLPPRYKPMIMALKSSGVDVTSGLVKTKLSQEVRDGSTMSEIEQCGYYAQ